MSTLLHIRRHVEQYEERREICHILLPVLSSLSRTPFSSPSLPLCLTPLPFSFSGRLIQQLQHLSQTRRVELAVHAGEKKQLEARAADLEARVDRVTNQNSELTKQNNCILAFFSSCNCVWKSFCATSVKSCSDWFHVLIGLHLSNFSKV